MNGKGKGPEKGRNLERFREGYDAIDWRRKRNASQMPCGEPEPLSATLTRSGGKSPQGTPKAAQGDRA